MPRSGEIGDVGGQVGLVRAEDIGLQPLLGRGLHVDVERGDDLVAAGVDGRAIGGVRARAAQQVGQLLADQQVELRGDHLGLRAG